jgi:hypothetical protein
MINTKARIVRPSRALIHRGDRTHTQGQVICPVSLRPTNKTVNKPGNPIPPEDVLLLDIFNLHYMCVGVLISPYSK